MKFPRRSDLNVGDHVLVKNHKQNTSETGIINNILTKSEQHPQGILVKLKSKTIARVQEKLDDRHDKPNDTSFEINQETAKDDYKTIWAAIQATKKSVTLEERRKSDPNAYNKWTETEEEELIQKFILNPTHHSIEKLSEELGRSKGGIRARLTKKGLLDLNGNIIKLLSNPKIEIRLKTSESNINQFVKLGDDKFPQKIFPKNKIPKDEDDQNEFKSSHHTPIGDVSKFKNNQKGLANISNNLKMEVALTISALANKKGGRLFIGVNDDGNPIGLDGDLKKFNGNFDSYRRHVIDGLSKFFPNDKPFLTSINWYIGEDKKFLVAEVGSGIKPIYLTFKNEKKLYVRNGPESELYTNPDDIIEYIKVRFPDTLSL